MESINRKGVSHNTTLTRMVLLELRQCNEDNPIITQSLVLVTERKMNENNRHARYLQVCEETNQRMAVLSVFYDAVALYISQKSDRLADWMVATKLVELVNRFRGMDMG